MAVGALSSARESVWMLRFSLAFFFPPLFPFIQIVYRWIFSDFLYPPAPFHAFRLGFFADSPSLAALALLAQPWQLKSSKIHAVKRPKMQT